MNSIFSSVKSSVSNLDTSFGKRKKTKDVDTSKILPVLILPGIMSSGLEVRKSGVNDKHIGERVWLNPVALGFGKLYFGKAFHSFSESRDENRCCSLTNADDISDCSSRSTASSGIANSGFFRSSLDKWNTRSSIFFLGNSSRDQNEDTNIQQELECKSAWMQHLTLTSDMCTEREGNEIRAIPGLGGVDFLTDIATFKVGASYVFGPVIKLLCAHGYTKGNNLDAMPYDWRIPPSVLESRDAYFTKTMERIEQMYTDNGDKPVVLLCHSMGCKTGHYLLNFAFAKKGREWIDQFVHTYMPIGAPHIGASSLIGSSFAASLNAMLDPLLTNEERLIFGRSLGSVGWLMPTHLPSIERNAPPTIFCKNEGLLSVEILTSTKDPLGDVRKLVTTKHGSRRVHPFRIHVSYGVREERGRTKQRSRVAQEVNGDGGVKGDSTKEQFFALPSSKFLFPTPPKLEGNDSLKCLQFKLKELGGGARAFDVEPIHPALDVLRKTLDRVHLTNIVINEANKKAKKHKMTMAMTEPLEINVNDLLNAGEKGLLIEVPLIARVDMSLFKMKPKDSHRTVPLKIRVTWTPPVTNDADDLTNPIAMLPSQYTERNHHLSPSSCVTQPSFVPNPKVVSTNDESDFGYTPLSGQSLLREEGLEHNFLRLTREVYKRDPIGPRSQSSFEKPIVKRIFAIYGVNVDTEVSKVCSRVPSYVEDETPEEKHARPRFRVDTETKLANGTESSGHKLMDGALFEHAKTPQKDLLTGKDIYRSGDGSVPYYSLQQCQVWAKQVLDNAEDNDMVRIEELPGAEHREILSDARFHNLLVDYLTGETTL